MPRVFILYEHAAGLSLFDCKGINEIAIQEKAVQQSIVDFNKFSQMVTLFAFRPFPSTEVAHETMNLITEGQPSEFLLNFLATSLPDQSSSKNKSGVMVGISESKLAGFVKDQLGINCVSDDLIREIIRGIRLHFNKFLDKVSAEDLDLAQLGLGHSYSRSKVKFNQHGDDNMVISAVALLTGLDKDFNTFSMRLREWYSVHFPELSHLIEDHKKYAQCVQVIGNRMDENHHIREFDRDALNLILDDPELTEKIIEAAQNSIGREVDNVDLSRIVSMASRVESLGDYKKNLSDYLYRRMHNISPNLTALIGERMGAQLILASGSLTNLAKAPSSTVQLLGSEKALFNALKKHKNTPKYGMLYNSGPVSQASPTDKGRVARSLANKLSIAARIDAFSDEFRSGHFGLLMKEMMETKVKALGTNAQVKPNLENMVEAVQETRRYEQNEGAEEAKNDGMEITHTIPNAEVKTEENPVETPRKRRKKHHHHHNDEEQQEQQQVEQQQEQQVEEQPEQQQEQVVVEETPQVQEEVAEVAAADQQTEHKKRRKRHRKPEAEEAA